MMMKNTTLEQVKELTTSFRMDMLEPNTEADMIFSAITILAAECRKYGTVSTGSPDPTKCFVTGLGVNASAIVGENSTIFLQLLNYEGQPCMVATVSVSSELASQILGTRSRSSIKRIGQNKYEISYQPTVKGKHHLHIKVEGQPIRGSPFLVRL